VSTLNVDLICTDADRADEMGATALSNMQPTVAVRDDARQKALDDVETALENQTPAVLATQLTRPETELTDVVKYRALWRLCRSAMTHKDDRYATLRKDYEREYESALGRHYSVIEGQRAVAGSLSISVHRR
jgi:hypothetical protein